MTTPERWPACGGARRSEPALPRPSLHYRADRRQPGRSQRRGPPTDAPGRRTAARSAGRTTLISAASSVSRPRRTASTSRGWRPSATAASFSACAGRCCAAGRCCSSCKLRDSGTGRLEPEPIGPAGRPYRRHFLDLAGLGLRELAHDGNDLLLLAGPTMDLDGPVHVYRWRGALAVAGDSLVRADELGPPVLSPPYGRGRDHAEGMTLLGGNELLVVYDSPDEATRFHRRDGPARRCLPPRGGSRKISTSAVRTVPRDQFQPEPAYI